ncbi:hypothetical protein DBV15_06905 [Temnothorax longispinosus]|uniref:Uncharacterized protein n=1 Tax=Temnothorax longispinosus TaxID=300112 RepID=A0A4V3S625_9HYME|nr:hypothetical protein DBV15_06905 [Temnothorax longispinosus]
MARKGDGNRKKAIRAAENREIEDLSPRVSKRFRTAENAFSHSGSIDLHARPLRDTRLAGISCSRSRRLDVWRFIRACKAHQPSASERGVPEQTNERMNDKRARHTRRRGKVSGTGLSRCYVQRECVLKYATRAAHCERVLVLGLICTDVLLTRRKSRVRKEKRIVSNNASDEKKLRTPVAGSAWFLIFCVNARCAQRSVAKFNNHALKSGTMPTSREAAETRELTSSRAIVYSIPGIFNLVLFGISMFAQSDEYFARISGPNTSNHALAKSPDKLSLWGHVPGKKVFREPPNLYLPSARTRDYLFFPGGYTAPAARVGASAISPTGGECTVVESLRIPRRASRARNCELARLGALQSPLAATAVAAAVATFCSFVPSRLQARRETDTAYDTATLRHFTSTPKTCDLREWIPYWVQKYVSIDILRTTRASQSQNDQSRVYLTLCGSEARWEAADDLSTVVQDRVIIDLGSRRRGSGDVGYSRRTQSETRQMVKSRPAQKPPCARATANNMQDTTRCAHYRGQ